jgi:proline iminopeptidase
MPHGAEHIRRYEETDGKEGHFWINSVPTLVLTTRGAKPGGDRKSALIYQQTEGKYLVVASDGSAPNHPELIPQAARSPRRHRAGSRPGNRQNGHPDERAKLWHLMTSVWPAYANYERKTTREIPLVILEPTAR